MSDNRLVVIENDIYALKPTFQSVLADSAIVFEREAAFAMQAIGSNDYLMGVASSNRQSVINAITNVASIGISLNPASKQAYLVPRDGRVCLDISYMGLLDLAVASGSICWGKAELVHANDTFHLNGMDKAPTHQYNPFAKAEDRGEIVGTYVVAKLPNGDYLTETMTIDAVRAIRDRSSAWKAWISKKKSCPWVTDEGEMVKKTVIKRGSKTWPKTGRLDQAIQHLNLDGGEGLAVLEQGNPEQATDRIDPQPLIDGIAALRTDEEAAAYWKQHNGKLAKQPQDHARFKVAVMAHRTMLRERQASKDGAEDATYTATKTTQAA